MSKIILDLTTTLDGYISGPDSEIDWIVEDDSTDFGDILSEILSGIDAIFYGRVSYELWGNYQPPEQASAKLKEAYGLLHSKTKYVFSKTMESDHTNAIFIKSDIEKSVLEIKKNQKGNIWLYGGGKLITTFINLGLIDVYRLSIQPVILGNGIPLFKDITQQVGLELIETKKSKSGVVLLIYSKK
ncbi:dihydrofolate reductase family protein [Galbibacter sp. EGI 63066]|uniref:dihydrofolate reductase family protein n=1 Tax=Galbibacter sp. EGI 63066 TaxID=2993559 RepID=UPI002249988A|nr:dihydrofolate reductase family protein [Galbibacter sp. EGI 63066]MCX2679782.1 dihydrofolate reductase family protein [Galbibacter sp. EGI 63066]